MNKRRDFADDLIACEGTTPVLRNKYEKEVTAMLEKQLGTAGRSMWIFWTIFGLSLAILFGYVAIWSYGDLPLWGTGIFALSAAFGLIHAGISSWIAYSGRLLMKTQPPALAGLAWGLTVIVVTTYLVAMPDSIRGVRALVGRLVFLVMAAVFMISCRTEQAELRTEEKLLQIEYRIAALSEQLNDPRNG